MLFPTLGNRIRLASYAFGVSRCGLCALASSQSKRGIFINYKTYVEGQPKVFEFVDIYENSPAQKRQN